MDYVTNNLAESFNNWIKQYKSMNLDDLMDKDQTIIYDQVEPKKENWKQNRWLDSSPHN